MKNSWRSILQLIRLIDNRPVKRLNIKKAFVQKTASEITGGTIKKNNISQ